MSSPDSQQEVLPPEQKKEAVTEEMNATETAEAGLALAENNVVAMQHGTEQHSRALAPADSFVQPLIEKAAESGNIEMLKQLMDLRDRDKAWHAKQAYETDFAAMKPHLPRVVKLHNNTQTKSKYAKLEDINNAIDPVLARFGFGTGAKLLDQTESTVTVQVEIHHRNGHVETMPITMPLDDVGIAGAKNKTAVHAISSAIMYCRRVGVCLMLNLSTGDDNDGNRDGALVTDEQAIEIDLLLKESNANRAQFFELMGLKDEMDSRKILASDFSAAVRKLEEKIALNKKKAEDAAAKKAGAKA